MSLPHFYKIPHETGKQLDALLFLAILVLTIAGWPLGAHAQSDGDTASEAEANKPVIEERPDVCLPDEMTLPKGFELMEDGADVVELPIELEADTIESPDGDTVILSGNAIVQQGPQSITADKLQFDNQTYQLDAEGNVVFFTPSGDKLIADSMGLEVETRLGSAESPQFWIAEREAKKKRRKVTLLDDFGGANEEYEEEESEEEKSKPEPSEGTVYISARGEAERMFFEGHERERLQDVRITSCVEGQDDVYVTAKEMVLDHGTGIGTAKHLKVRFFNIPIFYFPRASFPITSERKTGFLFPTVGYDDESGYVLEVPYYWNIAPNVDATLTTRYLSERGVQALGEVRYITENNEGELRAEILPGDDLFGEDRHALSYDNVFSKDKWLGRIDLNDVSDDEYLDDFSNDVEISSATFLDQEAQLRYSARYWHLSGRLRDFEIVNDELDEINEPYSQLPEIDFGARSPYRRGQLFRFELDSTLTNFDHPSDEKITGTRFSATPGVRMPFRKIYGYVEPELTVRHTSYSLDNIMDDEEDNPSVTVPVFTTDASIFFERETALYGKEITQTLEPRLFYAFIPEEDQDDIPIFDTGEVRFSNFGTLFREDRFFGDDRVGDTNQLTIGVTSRFLETDTAEERIRASVGQVIYFDDREVQLTPDAEVEDESTSDFVAELEADVTENLTLEAFYVYDPEDGETDQIRFEAAYDPDRNKFYYEQGRQRYIELEYLFDRNTLADIDPLAKDIEQLYLDTRWPITSHWRFLFTHRYDIEDSENLETALGFEYDACCWLFRVVSQQRVDRDDDDELKRNIFFTLELDQLGALRSRL